jgi:hypothetical protein
MIDDDNNLGSWQLSDVFIAVLLVLFLALISIGWI